MAIKNYLLYLLILIGPFILCCQSICYYDGQAYDEMESWNASCNICHCHLSTVSCTKIACPIVQCKNDEVASLLDDNCCPQCTTFKKPCIDGDISHAHQEVWSSDTDCVLYQCQDGISVPHVIKCPSLACPKGKQLHTPPDECCPRCVLSTCMNENKATISENCFSRHNDTGRKCVSSFPQSEEDFAILSKDTCILCIARNGERKCYERKCLLCEESRNVSDSHPCCPCSKSNCSIECGNCLDDNSNFCTSCEDLEKVLHNGKCIEKCPKGYYSDERKQCKNCSPTCKTCFGNMTSQCFSCKKGFLLEKGRCVKICSPGFYPSKGHCLECHESCSECQGLGAGNCTACALTGQLLQDGKCVEECYGHFYVSDSYCLPCNESCARCLKDGTCQFCEQNFYLEEGECVPYCSPSYYTFLDAYCLPCHDECQQCFGPLAYQCSSCPFGQFLFKNSCVWACGQGYFGDLGAGICEACHPDCRTCLGGAAKDKCLSCSSGYLLPYIGTHFGPCVDECPPQYFLDSGICTVCHETCETCFGPNDTECTSCNSSLFFKHGRCVPHCSNGYFQDLGVCYACHPSCASCYGFNSDECYTCPPGRVFKDGSCISACGKGEYKDTDGSCKRCHPTCSDCKLNSTEDESVRCLECKNQQKSILNAECSSGCYPNFYLNNYHVCQECHPSCATCERHGATSCASCWDGNFLTHLGSCEPQCHLGYFPLNGLCQACNYNCHHCISASTCLRCKGDLVLQFGECVPQCSNQHYVDTVSRECKECSWECHTCRGPLPTDCTSCMPGKLFEDGACVDQCSNRFFQNGSLCQTCDLKCLTCSTLNKCTSCDLPLLLLKGECIDDCGAGRYADFEKLICKECSSGCAFCLSAEQCDLCKNGFYLYEAACVQNCPPEYFADDTSRICKSK
ncbi:extracellular matrix protein FRAS1-like [Stegodyphus dumicola]|uniref:extracellular matrix protein FRAS1-like n=1 Tax=Stegodyphus dumicola TaxID=202533 RepID=UPI0015AEB16E|nr:extracellular matrix protein FRAS1-like [Stegodyphus dumicola]